ncbi:hypothetical protein NIES4101_85710 [Calothrix sp. NIES-4101]|nr:hypothetical protein NIES4101_85710 [Calothrix sp. NIES-4101]
MTQLLNMPPTQLTGRLLDVLEDIISNLEIHPDFSIRHPNYKPLELPRDVVERFQKLPEQMQQKYMSLQLRSFLYGIYYNGYLQNILAPNADENRLLLDLENNTFLGVNLAFYQQLHESNSGEGYFDPGWAVIKEEEDGYLVVKKGALRLHIYPDKHLQSTQKSATVGEMVAIRLPKNVVQNGFYMAVGNAGIHSHNDLEEQEQLTRIYFNFTPTGAVEVMRGLTQQLNAIALPFTFKVLYNPGDYKRYDAGVLYFDKKNYPAVRKVLELVYQENKSHFVSEIPLFTKQLAPGLGLAEEPDQKFGTQESFGMNRCQIVANGLLESWYQGNNSTVGKMKAILGEFSKLGINIQQPYLNADSEEIYEFMESC